MLQWSKQVYFAWLLGPIKSLGKRTWKPKTIWVGRGSRQPEWMGSFLMLFLLPFIGVCAICVPKLESKEPRAVCGSLLSPRATGWCLCTTSLCELKKTCQFEMHLHPWDHKHETHRPAVMSDKFGFERFTLSDVLRGAEPLCLLYGLLFYLTCLHHYYFYPQSSQWKRLQIYFVGLVDVLAQIASHQCSAD